MDNNFSYSENFKGMWVEREIWEEENLTRLEKDIYSVIKNFAQNEDGCCIASNKYLAGYCKCSERKISQTIKKLIDMDCIEVVKFDGRKRHLSIKSHDESEKVRGRVEQSARQTSKKCEADPKIFLPYKNIYKKDYKKDYIVQGSNSGEPSSLGSFGNPGESVYKDEFDSDKLRKQITKACMSKGITDDHNIDRAVRIISYYYQKYSRTFNREHPRISSTSMKEVVEMILGHELMGYKDFEDYKEAIDKHFMTRYRDCDYNICHFATDGILTNRCYETCY